MNNQNNETMLYDVFICHASQDKDAVVRPLAELLRENHIEVWYDEFSLQVGDSIRRAIDKGLARSRFGIVVLSKDFFQKEWPQYELDGLVEKEISGHQKVILPIWHEVDHSYVIKYSSPLAGRLAVNTSMGLVAVANQLSRAIKPQESPLIIARDRLIDWNNTPPVITDKHWLNVIEASNNFLPFGATYDESAEWGRWSFPLPPKSDNPQEWGERLAWAYMQMNWVKRAEEIPVTPLTPFQEVHDFIYRNPGLLETCMDFPTLLIEWAPQLVIPGFEGELFEMIEQAYQSSCNKNSKTAKDNGIGETALTVDVSPPPRDEEFALRHPTFGNYNPVVIAKAYFHGGMFGPTPSPYEEADHLFWLLSQSSEWLPQKVRECLLEGISKCTRWRWHHPLASGNSWVNYGALDDAISKSTTFRSIKLTKNMASDLESRISLSIKTLKLPESIATIKNRFLDYHVIEKTIAAEKEIRNGQMGRKKISRKKQKRKI